MPGSACLIFNPVAGQGDSEEQLALIRSLLEPEIDLDIRLTTPEVEADQLAKQALDAGAEAILAAGGDGTLSAAAGALIGSNIPLGILSCGTANSFASALNVPANLEEACQVILAGNTRRVDAAYCNDKPMILLTGVGFEAEMVEAADREAKNRLGVLAYVLAGLRQLRNLKHFKAKVETDDKVITVVASSIAVANAAPPTSILAQGPAGIVADDGLLDLTIIAPRNVVGAIAAFFDLFRTAVLRTAAKREDIGYLRSSRIKITTQVPQKVAIDGEVVGETPVEVECIPQGLVVFAPQLQPPEPEERLENLPKLKVEPKHPE